MTDRDLLSQALDALETICAEPSDTRPRTNPFTTITALRAALAAPMPEPVAWPPEVSDAVLDTPEPDKWVDIGEARPLPMFHMHTLMRYGEKCAESGITHGVKTTHPAQTGPWMPIETAPKDGSMFLIWVDGVVYGEDDEGQRFQQEESQVDFAQWRATDDGGYLDCFGYPYPYDQGGATHWMPLPAAPGAAPPAAPAPVVREPQDDLIDAVIRDVAELDYSSPEGMPDVMLVTADELRGILQAHGIGGGNG